MSVYNTSLAHIGADLTETAHCLMDMMAYGDLTPEERDQVLDHYTAIVKASSFMWELEHTLARRSQAKASEEQA